MKKTLFLALLILLGVGSAGAQTRITGTVTSAEDGKPLPFVTVAAKGSTVVATTTTEGKYSINVPAGSTALTFSFVGLKAAEVEIGGRSVIDIALELEAESLDAAVVVGYGTQSVRTMTSSIATVKASAIKDAPNVSIDQTLQGRASGVQITTPSGVVGQPPIVRVRGVNSITSGTSPLYVVDGIPMYTGDIGVIGQANGLADINPNDILSVDILKDAAAAALYGSRAANGVVLITTKTGNREKVKVTYDGWFGFSSRTNFIDVMNAQEYVDFKNMAVKNRYGTDEISLTGGYVSPYGTKAFNMMTDGNGNVVDSDWSKTVFQTGFSQSHSIAVSGGSPTIIYYVSGSYTDQEGMVIGDKYDKLGVKANVSVNATQWLKLSANTAASDGTSAHIDAARAGSNFAVGGFPRLAMVNTPNGRIYNDDGTPYYNPAGGLGYGPNTVNNTFSNPLVLADIGNNVSTEVTRLINTFAAEVKPIKGLTLKTQYGIDYAFTDDQRFWSPLHGDGYNFDGFATAASAQNKQWTWTNTASYAFSLGNHNFNLLAGTEANQTDFKVWGIDRQTLTDLKYTYIQGSYIDNSASDAMDRTGNALVSYLGRINYDYKSKYLLSLNFRRDGYSALGSNNRWGNFGGISAAWRVSEEKFFEPIKHIVSELKARGSWGQVGNVNILDYASKSYYSPFYYGSNGSYALGQIGDSNLKWETSTKMDVGFTAEFLRNISLDFSYYQTKTDDLILSVPQAPSKGVPGNVIRANAGGMKNSGIEVTISADVFKKKNFSWNTSFNVTTNKNEVTHLADGVTEILGGDRSGLETTNITVVGKSIGQLYVAQTRGIDPATGRRVFVTADGTEVIMKFESGGANAGYYLRNSPSTRYNGVISTDDYMISGNTLPTYYGGWNNTFRLYGFDISLFFQFSGGNKIYNGTKATMADMRYWNNAAEVKDNYWTTVGTGATYAYPIYGDNVSNGSSNPISDWVENGDYLRFKNVVIGYTFNTSSWSKKIGISSLRVYGQVQNLFTITGYSGLDPEALTNVANYNLAGGTDKNTMPQSRTFTFGLNLSF